jgi:N-acetylglucosamine-6-phosphate deacetylase
VRAELICDGVHVDDRVIQLARRVKGPEGLVAVSDAMPLAGLGPAAGSFCGREVQSDGLCATLDDGTLAGSAMLLPAALRRTADALELTPSEVVSLGSTAPALDLGLPRTGRIGRGCRADLVVWERDTAVAVLRGGEGTLPADWRIR